MAQRHKAAVLQQKGERLSISDRITPEPGPDEILIEVKVTAVNPIDYCQRDLGFPPIPSYPAVPGCDISGVIAKTGSNVSDASPPGTRVIAFASSYFFNGSADHGSFQEYVLAPSEAVIELPENLSFEEGAICPVAGFTALTSWTTIGIPLDTRYSPADKQAVLIWGGASSVGTFTIQTAKAMGFIIYATASPKNHEYLRALGADVVFDYASPDTVSQIVDAVKKDGTILETACCVTEGSLQPTLDVLEMTKGVAMAKVAHAPPLLPEAPTLEGVTIEFVYPPLDPAERKEHMRQCFHVWLEPGLRSGKFVPSPRVQVVDGGLEGLNEALDILKAGVSATKLIVKP